MWPITLSATVVAALIGRAVSQATLTTSAALMTVEGLSSESAKSSLKSEGGCCAALSLLLHGKVVYPSSSAYNTSLASYYAQQEAEVHPSCIVQPTSTTDVSLAVFLLTLGGELFPGKCNFAVRSGGHTTWAGAANIAGGVTIDLAGLNKVEVGAGGSTVNIGPGNRWVDVYGKLDAAGVTVPGGRVATVGVGGLITGGGFSHWSAQLGFVADSVTNFEVVLASGQVVNANAKSNSDLFKALKGGSNNFGIVTQFTLRSFPQKDYMSGLLISTDAYLSEQFQYLVDFCGQPNFDVKAAMILNVIWQIATNSFLVLTNPSYTDAVLNPPVLSNFTSVPGILNTLRISNSTSFAEELPTPPGSREMMVTATFKNNVDMLNAFHALNIAALEPLGNMGSDFGWVIAYQPDPSVMFSYAASSGGNVLGLDASSGNLINVLLTATWSDKANDDLVKGQAKQLFDQAHAKAVELGADFPFVYLPYAYSFQDPIDGYGAANVAYMKKVSKKYDPTSVFQTQVPGGFKL